MSPVEWYYARGNKQMGPVPSPELKRMAAAGELRPEDLVWREGMAEWTLARNVRGLFEEQNKAVAAIAEVTAARPSAGTSAVGVPDRPVVSRDRREPTRHPFDVLLGWVAAYFDVAFLDKTTRVLRACGLYGLLAAMALVAAFAVVVAVKTHSGNHVPEALGFLAVLAVLQYAAGRYCDALEQLNRTTATSLASNALPYCCALACIAAGAIVLLRSVVAGVSLATHSDVTAGVASVLWGAVLVAFCGYGAIVAVNLPALNVTIDPELRAGGEAIGVLAFLLKALLRWVPVVYGAGVVCGAIWMGYACYQGCCAADLATDMRVGITVSLVTALITWTKACFTVILAAASPEVAYFLFLFYCLLSEVCRAVLILPGRSDKLTAKAEEKKEGQEPQSPGA